MNIKKSISIALVMCLAVLQPLELAAQTLDELQAEIEKIKEENAQTLEDQEKIKADMENTEQEISDVKAEIDDMNAQIASAQAEVDQKNVEISNQKAKIEEIQAKIPEATESAGEVLSSLQHIENSNIMIQLIMSPSNGDSNILRNLTSINQLSQFASDKVIELIDLEKELQYEKTVLDKELAELETTEINLEGKQKELTAKEEEFQVVLSNQSDSATEIDSTLEQQAEDQKMMEDTLAYYEGFGCSGSDVVGSKCGGLADDDGDGIINADDSCPNQYGTKSNGCPVPKTTNNNSSSGSSGNGSSGSNTSTSSSGFIRPLSSGVVTCEWMCYSNHTGTDMDYADYAPVLATANGVVISARGGCDPFYSGVNTCNGGYGNYVMMMHNTSSGVVFSLYGHLASFNVSQGQTVSQGTQIGLLGDSGNSAGSHLHFELYPDSNGNGVPDDYKSNSRNYVSYPSTGVFW